MSMETFWVYVVVPTATAIAAVFAFAKLIRENQKLKREIAKLAAEEEARHARVVPPTAAEIKEYAGGRRTMPGGLWGWWYRLLQLFR